MQIIQNDRYEDYRNGNEIRSKIMIVIFSLHQRERTRAPSQSLKGCGALHLALPPDPVDLLISNTPPRPDGR